MPGVLRGDTDPDAEVAGTTGCVLAGVSCAIADSPVADGRLVVEYCCACAGVAKAMGMANAEPMQEIQPAVR